MSNLLEIAAQNTVVALVFAVFVYGLTRNWRSPQVAHVLWLLVLLKLVSPPILRIDLSGIRQTRSTPQRGQSIADVSTIHGRTIESPPGFVARPPLSTIPRPQATSGRAWPRRRHPAVLESTKELFFWCWFGGVCMCACSPQCESSVLKSSCEIHCLPPSNCNDSREIAGTLGVRRVPDVRYVHCVKVPMLWCAGLRPTVVLPMRLLCRFNDKSLALILAHELAHLRRGDHWVRAVEMIVSTVYWWNPLVGVIRRQIHQAEELCCDGWVQWAFPDARKNTPKSCSRPRSRLTSRRSALGCCLPVHFCVHCH